MHYQKLDGRFGHLVGLRDSTDQGALARNHMSFSAGELRPPGEVAVAAKGKKGKSRVSRNLWVKLGVCLKKTNKVPFLVISLVLGLTNIFFLGKYLFFF